MLLCSGEGGVVPVTGFSPLLDGDGVASLNCVFENLELISRFSPLLDGDGVASSKYRPGSDPIHAFQSPSRWGRCCFTNPPATDVDGVFGFSPLLDGDGVASVQRGALFDLSLRFSPLLDGDGVASSSHGLGAYPAMRFQSPSRWGRCCFSSSRCLACCLFNRFSPLLDGDGVASRRPLSIAWVDPRFSPLLDGDGVASRLRGRSSTKDCYVSVPFSMGTVLLPNDPRRHAPGPRVSVPFSMGTVLLHEHESVHDRWYFRFSPLLDGDGVASALELPHSTPLIIGLRAHFGADEVSARKRARSANSLITTRLRNSLRTRIPRTVSSRP